jgi:hypothetical protein
MTRTIIETVAKQCLRMLSFGKTINTTVIIELVEIYKEKNGITLTKAQDLFVVNSVSTEIYLT